MSARLVGDALWLGCSPTEMAVLAIIADQSDDDGVGCFYKVATIASRTGMTERGVQKVLRRLEERQLLKAVAQANASNDWIINVDVLRSIADAARDAARQKTSPKRSRRPRGERSSPTEGVNVVRVRGEPSSPYSSKDSNTPLTPHSVQPPRRRQRRAEPPAPVPIELPVGLEGSEATRFREVALRHLGEATYRSHLAECHVYPEDSGLVVRTKFAVIADDLQNGHRAEKLRRAAQEMRTGLRVEMHSPAKPRAPDPKVADAVRQLDAIRGGREARTAAQAGGRR